MKYEVYEFTFDHDNQIFEFYSIGIHGAIRKRIEFDPTDLPQLYNLGFGDVTENDEIDDYSISNNGDRDKILATVASIIEIYTAKYPERWILIRGSTVERTRLYRMAIGLNLEELSKKFDIYANTDNKNDFIQFIKNMNVKTFLIKRKNT